ncbi:hypothetical protein ABT126_13755 [Streptomyces sp. NPDC002012]|uniref:MmyB family transcriptional regulator n=1 Tax=Streptomyces sp. NPDC002012 TaxID=3154532 RepID=UPI0033285EDA
MVDHEVADADGPDLAVGQERLQGALRPRSFCGGGDFARRWARHDVKFHRSGVKHLHHPMVGDLALPYEAMDLPADPGLRLNFYTPEPDSREREALGLLASWASSGTVVPTVND